MQKKPTEASSVDIRPSYTKDQILSFQNDEASSDLLFIIERYIDILCPSRIMKPFFTGQMN